MLSNQRDSEVFKTIGKIKPRAAVSGFFNTHDETAENFGILSEKASEAFPQVQAGLVFAVRDVYNRIEVIGLEGGIEQCRES